MKIDTDKAREIFKRAVEVQKMILAAMEDLKQLRADEIEALIDDGMDKDAKKAIRADLSEIIALAKIEAKGEMEREKVAAKMEHRREVAEVVGVQLDMLGADEAAEDEQDLAEIRKRLAERNAPPDDMPDLPPVLDRRAQLAGVG